ncbi:hypothetical protein E2C01_022244 [Portunus trituberculatus]|uniref:Uncharacterized protein n=1 Tax=Portunus trituberculatus TaxID=210409 RepID=A0A5B7E6R7_PORTR|nr:hypothetical protein [Portunus trituberculatus]
MDRFWDELVSCIISASMGRGRGYLELVFKACRYRRLVPSCRPLPPRERPRTAVPRRVCCSANSLLIGEVVFAVAAQLEGKGVGRKAEGQAARGGRQRGGGSGVTGGQSAREHGQRGSRLLAAKSPDCKIVELRAFLGATLFPLRRPHNSIKNIIIVISSTCPQRKQRKKSAAVCDEEEVVGQDEQEGKARPDCCSRKGNLPEVRQGMEPDQELKEGEGVGMLFGSLASCVFRERKSITDFSY